MDAVEEIKRRVDFVEYVGRNTKLLKSGRNFKGCCPFHSEKTPSFYVYPDRGAWHCFGACGEGGDLFTFVLKRENVDFKAALRLLAQEAGIELSPGAAAKRGRSDQLIAVLAATVEYYERSFREASGDAARAYIIGKRGIKAETATRFRLGWAPDEWRGLRDHLASRGFGERDAVAAGVLVEPESGGTPYDRFRGRVIIPIQDERGRVIALGGRGLHGEMPKYLNSPQTDVFDKSRTLYGLHLAADEIRKQQTVVVVEGYMDVIGPHQAGFTNVVATMGTSLTEHHVGLLKRFAQRVVLAMDPDAAGTAAAERAGSLLLGSATPEMAAESARSAQAITGGHQLELRVAQLPAGKDPDEVAREDPETWRAAVELAKPFAEFLIMRLMKPSVTESPLEARQIVDRVRPVLLAVQDPVERAMYVQRIARQLGVNEAAVTERLRIPRGRGPTPAVAQGTVPVEGRTPEFFLLATLLRCPELRESYGRLIPEQFFNNGIDREVFRQWTSGAVDAPDADGDDTVRRRREELIGYRMPPLTAAQADSVVRSKIEAIKRERDGIHLAAAGERMGELVREIGETETADLAANAWRGLPLPPGSREAVETVIEVHQLSMSMHRREEPAGA